MAKIGSMLQLIELKNMLKLKQKQRQGCSEPDFRTELDSAEKHVCL